VLNDKQKGILKMVIDGFELSVWPRFTYKYTRSFIKNCANGYLEVAKWLTTNFKINVNACDGEAFRWACKNGHLEIAKWLTTNFKINVNARNDLAFCYACENRHLKVAKWLCKIEPKYSINVLDNGEIKFQIRK
jgi:ankyrin repeat protein